MRHLFLVLAYALALALYLGVGWVAGIVVLVAALAGTVRTLVVTARELAPTATCPRQHVFPTYGRVECPQCRWAAEGSLWRCANCDARFNTRCPTCGLSVRNPSL